ncbi:unnamed protein product [Thelazia callipaeda]|uniref:BRX domain-containing protein n=1 Tax=Thelazia callipaeda TaxID=103827 RepID=A0A0N5CZK1_THECL|nr:unnamed protein product [Thelazia callipaeda]
MQASHPHLPKSRSFKRNSVRALKNAHQPPGGLEMILASVDESLQLLSDLTNNTVASSHCTNENEDLHKLGSIPNADFPFIDDYDDNEDAANISSTKPINSGENTNSFCDETPVSSSKIVNIDLTGEEIIQWMGGLPILNPDKMLAYFCKGSRLETKKNCQREKPYQIFSLSRLQEPKKDVIWSMNLIHEVRVTFLQIGVTENGLTKMA